jgi:DNA primase
MMKIPEDKIDEIRNAVDIVELVGSVVSLKKRGKNYVGLCPFHHEKTPSFNVSPDRQMYHCFGCGVGGNVFTFMMQHEKVSFIEAVRVLAERTGISLPTYESEQAEQAASEHEQLFHIMSLAGLFFYHQLTTTSEGEFALRYFHQRGFSDETIRRFGLGYSLQSWDGLITHMQQQGIAESFLEKAGLVRRREDQSYYDYFRGRAMFPIFSATGRGIAFGARKLYDDDKLAKYVNSPETLLYSKSRVLYGLYNAREAVRREENAILVEGYADLISVFQAGILNVVASSGTALTHEQIQLIGRYTHNVTLVYDADSAGAQAMMRGVDLVIENGLDVRVAELPEGDDPDSFVKSKGAEAFRELIKNSISFIEFKARSFDRQGKLATPEGQAEATRSIVQTIAKIPDELRRNFFIKEVADRYKLYESVLYRELDKQLKSSDRRSQNAIRNRGRSQPPEPGEGRRVPVMNVPMADVTPRKEREISTAERDLVKLMLEDPGTMIEYILSHISIEEFEHPHTRAVAQLLLDKHRAGELIDPHILLEGELAAPLKSLITDVVISKYEISPGWAEQKPIDPTDIRQVAQAALVALMRRKYNVIIEENQRTLREASQRGEEVAVYVARHQELLLKKMQLDNEEFPLKKE